MKHGLLLLFLLCVFTGIDSVQAEDGIDAESLQGIYVGDDPGEFDKKTADQLRAGLQKIYGIKLPLLESVEDFENTRYVVVVGKDAALATEKLTEQDSIQLPAGGFIVRADASGVVIAGDDAWATQDGVYRFLENNGMRFLSPRFHKAQVEESENGLIPYFDITDAPDFLYRSGRSLVWHQMHHRLGDPRKGLDPELFEKDVTGSDLWIDHSAGYLVPKLMFYDSHPEYYAEVEGKRIAKDRFTDHRTPLCLSNSDVRKISAERALGWIEEEFEKSHFMVTYGDTGVWCQCSECLKLDVSPGAYSDRLLSWVNGIAAEVGKKYPDKILMTFAYSESSAPPAREVPADNVWIVGSTGLGNIAFWDHAWKSGAVPRRHLNKLEGWLKVVPDRFTVCEYQSNKYKPALVDTLKSRLQFYQDRGVRGVVFTFGLPQNFRGLWEYLYSNLMWDLDQDGMDLAQEYVDYHFKEAAAHVLEVITLSHERYKETLLAGIGLKSNYPQGYYSRAFTTAILNAFAKAAAAVRDDEKLLAEIQREEAYFIYDWLRHPGYDQLNNETRKTLTAQLERLLVLTGEDEEERSKLGRTLHRLALAVEDEYGGTQEIVEEWILLQKLHAPLYEKRADGVVLPPEAFRFAGFGPARYRYHCPPRDAVGVYVRDNSKHRSHRMVADFEWDLPLPDNGVYQLTLTGQVSGHPLKPHIKVLVNGAEVYGGSADFVSNNWSSQSYAIPADILRKGMNSIEIENSSSPLTVTRWNQRWCLVSKAEIIVKQENGTIQ